MTINSDDLDFGFNDDSGLDLNFGEDTEEPADLSEEDMAEGTEPAAVTTDLSGAAPTPVPVTPAAPEPTQAAPAAPVPPVQPDGTQPPTVEQPGAAETQPSVNIEEFVAANSDAIIGNLAAAHFRIDDATAESLGFSPEVREWVEKRDAKNFLLTMVQMNTALQKTLPAVVANLMDVTSRAKTTQEGFYQEFPDLSDKKHVPVLGQIAQTLRGLHPTMEKKAFQTLLGQTAHQMLGIPVKQAAPNGQRRGVVRGQPRPFTPAGSVTPQRNRGGNGQNLPTGLDAINAALMRGGDDY